MKNILIFFLSTFFVKNMNAQFAPQAEMFGSNAIYKDSNIFISWGNKCEIIRGWQNIADTSLGKVSTGDTLDANNKADGMIVSLGDGGEAIYYFDNPIMNGAGADFAIFENGFRNPTDSNLAYLELATVEVSNDGINYFSFQAESFIDTSTQIAGVGEYIDCRKINNLAGKYIASYGTPFDLDELSTILSLDVNNIRYVKIKDVVGSLAKENCSYDKNNFMINDPYPTPFPTGGFDLDAIGIIHQLYPTNTTSINFEDEISFYPNPCKDFIYFKNIDNFKKIKIFSVDGKLILHQEISNKLDIQFLNNGIYFLKIEKSDGTMYSKKIWKK